MVGGIFQLVAHNGYDSKYAKYINAISRNDIEFVKNLYEKNTINFEIEKWLINDSIYKESTNIFGYLIKSARYSHIEDVLKVCITNNRLYYVKHIFYSEKYRQTLNNLNVKVLLLSVSCKNSDIFNFLKEKSDISGYKNEILKEAIYKEKLEIIKDCISLGADEHINNSYLVEMCLHYGYIEILEYLLQNKACIDFDLNDVKLCNDYTKLFEMIKILLKNGMPIHKIEDRLFKKYKCKKCCYDEDYGCKNHFCEYCHFICDLNTDESCEQGYSCHNICIDSNKCKYVVDYICPHCEGICDCEIEDLELLFYIIDHGANYKKIFHELHSKAKIAICKRIMAAIKIQYFIRSIFEKPYYKDGTPGFYPMQTWKKIQELMIK